jgi:hypothetical protein
MDQEPSRPMRWLADALLGSPIPPPVWLDPSHAGSGWRAPGSRRYRYKVPAARIQAELEEMNSRVNPPVIQGWAWLLGLVCVGAWLLGLWLLAHGTGSATALGPILFVAPLPAWAVMVWIGAFLSHDVELRDGEVLVRRWTDVWLGRRGRVVGGRESAHATLRENSVELSGEAGTAEVSMAMWPSSSRRALQERLRAWEIPLGAAGQPHGERPHHARRRRRVRGADATER